MARTFETPMETNCVWHAIHHKPKFASNPSMFKPIDRGRSVSRTFVNIAAVVAIGVLTLKDSDGLAAVR
jgi:hypothetical protein